MNATHAKIRVKKIGAKQKLKATSHPTTKINFNYSLLAGVAGFAAESVL
jgi:hypothetical protein